MEHLLKAIAADPHRFGDEVYLPCPLRAVADTLRDCDIARHFVRDPAVSDVLACRHLYGRRTSRGCH